MPLHPFLQAFSDATKASGRPAFRDSTVEQARTRSAGLTERTGPGPKVDRVEELNISGRGGDIPARLFSTENPEAVVLYLHGGGWVLGSLNEWDALARTVANALSASVVLLDYRLAPEHPYPAALNDSWDALQWVAENMKQLAGRKVPLIIIGDSAGGNLAAVITHKARDAGAPTIDAQALIYPVTDARMNTPSCLEFDDYPLFSTDDLRWLTHHYVGDDTQLRSDPSVSPLLGELDNLPPAVVVTCQYDPLRDEGNLYAEALKAAGNQVIAHEAEGMAHAFTLMINLMPEATTWIEKIADDLRTLLRKKL